MILVTVFLSFFLSVSAAFAQVAFDNKTTFNGTNGTSTNSGAFTAAGANRLLTACVAWRDDGGPTTVSTITYNGVAMTELAAVVGTGDSYRLKFYYLINPAVGSNTFSLTMSGNAYRAVNVASFTGVHQITAFGTAVTNGASGSSGTSSSLDVAAGTNGMGQDCNSFNAANPGTITDGAGQTRLNVTQDGSGILIWLYSSYEAGSGTITMSETFSSVSMRHIAAPLLAAATAQEYAPLIIQ